VEAYAAPRIKICCIASLDEALLAIDHGAAAIGLVSAMPSGPGPIPEPLIVDIARALAGRPVRTFLLTSKPDATAIIAQVRRTGVNTVQICDRLAIGSHRDLRAALPGVDLVQVIHVQGERSVREAYEVVGLVDAILLDSGRPDAAVKELGGTGRTHDWSVSRRIRDLGAPLWLAGGLRSDNVAEAIAAVRPHGVDVCSGVRTAGRLDPRKLAAFVTAVERAG
jgi:phosphoribosylanthranilate isomerase